MASLFIQHEKGQYFLAGKCAYLELCYDTVNAILVRSLEHSTLWRKIC